MLVSVDGRARRIGPFNDAAAAANPSVSILRTTNSSARAVTVADRPCIALDRIRLTALHTLYFGSAALDFNLNLASVRFGHISFFISTSLAANDAKSFGCLFALQKQENRLCHEQYESAYGFCIYAIELACQRGNHVLVQ